MENIEEKLIALVQVKTVLYDTSDTDYMRTRYKQQIWDEIGEELNMTDYGRQKHSSNSRKSQQRRKFGFFRMTLNY
ncbi:hypothetical protein M8J77_018132 [Diaphorina citri]|nr:hypothetical protein M8J77_018132 [Diaphorina citri]